MDTNDKVIIGIIILLLTIVISSAYYIDNLQKQLDQKNIEAENWKTLYQLSEK